MKTALAALAAMLMLGCASTRLSPAGSHVQVASDAGVDGCAFIGLLVAEEGGNFKNYEGNVELVMYQLRNKAAALEATHVVVDPPLPNAGGAWWATSNCMNCVRLTGRAYRCE